MISFYNKFRRGAACFLAGTFLVGSLGLAGCATASTYSSDWREEYKMKDWLPPKVIQEYNPQEVWKNRIEDDVYQGYVAFIAYVGEGENRQKELFIGKFSDGNTTEIKRLTYSPEPESLPFISKSLRVGFARGPPNKKGYRVEDLYIINMDGTGEQLMPDEIRVNEYRKYEKRR